MIKLAGDQVIKSDNFLVFSSVNILILKVFLTVDSVVQKSGTLCVQTCSHLQANVG